jgi:hypothetical protein
MHPEIRGSCRFYVLLCIENKDIFDKRQEAYGEGCVSYAWLEKLAKAFREVHQTLADDFRSRKPPISNRVEHIHAKANASHVNLAQLWNRKGKA